MLRAQSQAGLLHSRHVSLLINPKRFIYFLLKRRSWLCNCFVEVFSAAVTAARRKVATETNKYMKLAFSVKTKQTSS